MTVTLIFTITCDRTGCRNRITLHGSETIRAAVARARAEGWTQSHNGSFTYSCPSHAYRKAA